MENYIIYTFEYKIYTFGKEIPISIAYEYCKWHSKTS